MTKLTRSQVKEWHDKARGFMDDAPDPRCTHIPACSILGEVCDVFDLCDALLEAWSDYHAHPAPEPSPDAGGESGDAA
jgi:hypothetical protein